LATQLRREPGETTTYLDYLGSKREQTVELPPKGVEEDVESVFLPPAQNVPPQWVYDDAPHPGGPGLVVQLGHLLLRLNYWLSGPPATQRERAHRSIQRWRDDWYISHSGF
jgi:hypothetical protein